MKGLSLEIRVGFLVLASLGLLVAFIFVFGGIDLSEGHTVYVDFDNPGAVKPGAGVNVGSIRVGTVEEIEYLGGRLDPETGRRPLIRLRLSIDPEIRDTIHQDASFYITSQGLLGESIVAIDPGSHDEPIIEENAVVEGIDPPRLDLALSLGYELLDNMVGLIANNREALEETLSHLGGIIRALNEILTENRGQIARILANVETATQEASQLMVSARTTVDGPEVQRTVRNLDRTLAAIARDIEPLLGDVRSAAHDASETLAVFGPEQRTQLQETVRHTSELAERANTTIADAQSIVAHIRSGQGTVGALLMDEEVYDDIQEMLRDIKHNPWKLFWRE